MKLLFVLLILFIISFLSVKFFNVFLGLAAIYLFWSGRINPKMIVQKGFLYQFGAGFLLMLFIYVLWQVLGYGVLVGFKFDIAMWIEIILVYILLWIVISEVGWSARIVLWSMMLACSFVWWGNIGWLEYLFFCLVFYKILVLAKTNKEMAFGFAGGFFLARYLFDFRLVLADNLVTMMPGAYLVGILSILVALIKWQLKFRK